MNANELPLGRARSRTYRFFEMLPAVISFGVPLAVIVVSVFDATIGALLVLSIVLLAAFRGFRGAIDAIRGYRRLRRGERTDWVAENATLATRVLAGELGERAPLPSEVVHAVIITAFNEPFDVVRTSIEALADASIGSDRLVVMLAYEARGGDEMRETAIRLEQAYGFRFRAFELVEHPADLPDEIPGKGANLSYAGRRLGEWIAERGIDPRLVVVTSLDCDNRPHPQYFAAVTNAFVLAPDRHRASFQPISLFTNNIWHAPAPTRLVAAGNSIWNLIATVRPFSVRNFASHAQPFSALAEMGFWSRRTIVEDGHQYWRSYFHFRGRYRAIPIRVPIYQDVVTTGEYLRTLRAQFSQLSRWAYGASDIPYVGVRVFSRRRVVPFWRSLVGFLVLLEGHVSLALVAPIVLVGAWVPFLIGHAVTAMQTSWYAASHSWFSIVTVERELRDDVLVVGLPAIVETIQRVAMPPLFVLVVLSLLLLPSRPRDFRRTRSLGMLAQWVLLPLTAVAYTAASSLTSQGRLLLGRYRERFDVTEKHSFESPRGPAEDPRPELVH